MMAVSFIGSVIMQVAPWPMASARNAWLSVWRSGRPNETLLAPRLMLTPNSWRSSWIVFRVTAPRVAVGADGQHQRVDDDIFDGDAQRGRPLDDLRRHRQPFLGRGRDAVVVHGQADHGRAAILDQRQDAAAAISPRR